VLNKIKRCAAHVLFKYVNRLPSRRGTNNGVAGHAVPDVKVGTQNNSFVRFWMENARAMLLAIKFMEYRCLRKIDKLAIQISFN
jgi:hypothetical protein